MRPASEVERRRLNDTVRRAVRDPEPVRATSARWPSACAPSCARSGSRSTEDDAAAEIGAECGNLLARIPGRARAHACCSAPTSTRCRTTGPIEPVLVDGGWESAGDTILGADNKAAVAMLLELARRAAVEGSPVGVELLFTVCEENGARGRQGVRRLAAAQPTFGYVFDHATPIGEVVVASPTYFRLRGRLPRRGRPRRHPPRGRAQRDPRRRARRSPRCRTGASTTRRRPTSATIARRRRRDERRGRALHGRSARRARSSDARGRGGRRPRWSTRSRRRQRPGVRVRRRRHRRARCSTATATRPRRPPVRRRRGGAARAAATTPRRIAHRRRLGRQRVRGRRPSLRQPRQRHRAQPRADRARQPGRALEGMLDVTLRAARRAGRGLGPRPPAAAGAELGPREARSRRRGAGACPSAARGTSSMTTISRGRL